MNNPFTSPTAVGVAIRVTIIPLLFILAAIGWLTEEQVATIKEYMDGVGGEALVAAITTLAGGAAWLYSVVKKSHSRKGEALANAADGKTAPVVAITPAGQADAVIGEQTPIVTPSGKEVK